LALATRVLLLLSLSVVLRLTAPLWELSQLGLFTDWLEKHPEINEVAGRDLIMLAGGLFLIGKSVFEIHAQQEGHHSDESSQPKKQLSFTTVLVQIAILDIVFSLDSVITAVGMVQAEGGNYWFGIGVMVTAIVLAMGVMLAFAGPVSRLVEKHPTLKMLALSFLLLIGVLLVAEGMGTPMDKGYIYFAMTFALLVELMNMRMRAKRPAAA
jgi:predicted tellurium resistance membrane protein TerC